SGALHLLINDKYFRSFGTFGQPNPFGGFMGLVAPISLMATLGYGKRAWSKHPLDTAYRDIFLIFFYGSSSIIILSGIVMSWSRGAWIGMIGALLVVALALPLKTWRGLALFGAIFGTVVLL